jgi:site-specific DNA-methyltransferase (adenine-specific)
METTTEIQQNGGPGLLSTALFGLRPYHEEAAVTIYHGDAMAVLRELPSESVDCIITDPPYSSGGMYRGDRAASTTAKYVQSGQVLQHGDFAGDNRDQRAYLAWCSLWLAECLRIAKPGAVCALFTDWRQLPITTDALQAGGFIWRGIGAWDKTEAARPMKGRYRNQCEYLVWGSRGGMADAGPCLPGVWRVTVGGSEKHHIAGKPEKLMQMLVEICPPGGTVLDPFCGSGTTLKAAKQTGRRAVGIEIGEQWATVARDRLSQDVLPLHCPNVKGHAPSPAGAGDETGGEG